MASVLIFRLLGPLAAWGGVAVGEVRDSDTVPSRSAILGLLGAALGLRRTDTDALDTLARDLRFAFRVDRAGTLLKDYHTAQVPSRSTLKRHPHRTRRDELNFPKEALNTILSTRQYREDAAFTILVSAPQTRITALAAALEQPLFVPYLGRKSCSLAWPMAPRVIEASNLVEAFRAFDTQEQAAQTRAGEPFQELSALACTSRVAGDPVELAWEAGLPLDTGLSTPLIHRVLRRDQPLHRLRWQFAERLESRALFPKEES